MENTSKRLEIRGGIVAKGNRGGRGKSAISTAKNGLQIGNESIAFDGDLTYTKNDTSITQAQRSVLDVWEAKREKMKIEYANAVGYMGSEYGELRGGPNGVNLPPKFFANKGSVITHIHPREDGGLGGTFSDADIFAWSRGNGMSIRAVAKEGTYSISKGKNFNGSGLSRWYTKAMNQRLDEHTDRKLALMKDMKSGKISYSTYTAEKTKSFNTALVDMHNDLMKNQSVYGYNYYLEKK